MCSERARQATAHYPARCRWGGGEAAHVQRVRCICPPAPTHQCPSAHQINVSSCAHLALGQPGSAPTQPPCWLRWAALHAALCAGQCAFWHSRLQGVGQEGGEAIGCCEQAGS